MELFLFSLVFLVGVALVIYGVREMFHRSRVNSLASFDSAENSPAAINLEPIEQYGWLVEPEVQHSLRELESLGFVQEGTFKVAQMSGLHIIGLIQPYQNLIASVYADARGITWVDISAVGVDSQVYTTSNSLSQELIEAQSRGSIRVDKSWSVVELFAQQSEICSEKELMPIKSGSFATIFERSYLNDMKQHNASGGVLSERAFRCQQELGGESLSEEEVSELYSAYVYRCGVIDLHRQCCEQYLSEVKEDAEGGSKKLLAMHEGIPIELLIPFLLEKFEITAELLTKIEAEIDYQADIRTNFKTLNLLLPESARARHIASVETPVLADIYCTD